MTPNCKHLQNLATLKTKGLGACDLHVLEIKNGGGVNFAASRFALFGVDAVESLVMHDDIPSNEVYADEAELILTVQQGDRAAFATLLREHERAIYAFLRARLTGTADAEDLCQEVFLRCFQGRDQLQRATRIRPWLFGIARNVLREHVRKLQRRREVRWTELCLELDQVVAGDDAMYSVEIEHLPACVELLGQSAREALDLRYRIRMRLSQIGEKLHRSEGAVKLLMFRARQALRQCLDRKVQRSDQNE